MPELARGPADVAHANECWQELPSRPAAASSPAPAAGTSAQEMDAPPNLDVGERFHACMKTTIQYIHSLIRCGRQVA